MKRGFTLIELLVVVLIIGILSAIALPQYTMAVEKAKSAEAISTLGALRKAVDAAQLSNSGVTITKDMLDIDLSTWENENWSYLIYDNIIAACRKSSGFTCPTTLSRIEAIKFVRYATGSSLKKVPECVDGKKEACISSCNLDESLYRSDTAAGSFVLVDNGMGKICCGAAFTSSQGISFCKSVNRQ